MDLEDHIRVLGRQIFALANEPGDSATLTERFDEWALNWMMRHEGLKTQLFRFVDTLPALRSPRSIARHLQEYVRAGIGGLPALTRTAAGLLPGNGWTAPIVAGAARSHVQRMAERFVAGGNLNQAEAAARRLRDQGLAFTIDLLGEAVITETEADTYQKQYLQLLAALPKRLNDLPSNDVLDFDSHGPIPRTNVSIKLSSLYSQFDPIDVEGTAAAVLERLRPVLRAARTARAFVNLDMEQRSYKQLTLDIFQRVLMEDEFRDWVDVGIAIQAYLRETLDDLVDLSEWSKRRGTPVWIRLVKGAYWDYETVIAAQNGWPAPVFLDKPETDANFEKCTAFLMEHHASLRPAIASHNIRSLASALAWSDHFRLDPLDVEFQMLYGMADEQKAALAAMGRRVRVYMPVGSLLPGMAYLIRRLLENTSNESFLRAGFVERVDEEILLMPPMLKTQKPAARHVAESSGSFSNEPPTDFSLESSRRAMGRALDSVRSQLGGSHLALIGGKRFGSTQWIESLNPSHKWQTIGRCAASTPQMAAEAVAAAKSAFATWRDEPVDDRAALLERVAQIMRRDRYELAAWEVFECGKPWREADADVAEAIDFCRYYAMQARRMNGAHGNDLPGETNRWENEPLGVATVIAPWNFPLAILCGMTAAAVVTGNTVVMKPAEQSSVVAAKLAEAFEEAGAPAGVVNYLPGIGEEIGPTLVRHPDTALIAFTGSRTVGLAINADAAQTPLNQDHVKRTITEMGGKNAIIIDDDADLDDAVLGVVNSAFGYAGQKCSACSRAIVLPEVYDIFLARLIDATRSLKVLPADDPACRVGPVIDREAFARIHRTIETAKRKTRLAFAPDVNSLAEEGHFIGPHIFADVTADNSLANEEVFGPVLCVMRAANWDEALSLANGVKYALTGGVYSRSPSHIERCRREFRVGNLYINRKITGALVGRQPFGGFKLSGGGTQAGGPDYLRHFVAQRCITENTLRHGFVPAENGVEN